MASPPPTVGDTDTVHPCQCHHGPGPSTRACNQEDSNEAIAGDIDGHIYASVKGFYAKYFEARTWSSAAEQIVQAANPESLDPQDLQSREGFHAWLLRYNSFLHEGAKLSRAGRVAQYAWIKGHTTCTLSSGIPVLLQMKDSNREPGWADVKIIGEFCQGGLGLYHVGLLQLCGHARAVFAHQPDRLFLHGFYVYEGTMELWMFDRSGIYSCEAFDIAIAPSRFLDVFTGYILMSDAELGFCALIKEDTVGKYVLCAGDDDEADDAEKLYLGDPPIFERLNKNIVGDGLTCYPARKSTSESWEFVVKLKWSAPNKNTEAKMLELATNRGVRGVLRLLSHQEVHSTENLHHGLLFGVPRKLKHIDSDDAATSGHLKPVVGVGVGAALDSTVPTTELGDFGKDKLVENKIFNLLVVSPLGRSLHRFDTVPELVGALRDAIQGHQSLYQVGGLLHRDICPSNIILTSNKSKGASPRGILIDFDSAKDVSTGPGSEQFEGIGTQFFKSIGVLQAYLPNNPHTYRHDLESFFYTFLFLATCRRPVPLGENQLQLPLTCIIGKWTLGRPVDQAKRKISGMLDDVEFARIAAEFTPEFKELAGLAENLRRALFPVIDGKLWTGTDMSVEGTHALYASILDAFDKVKDYDYRL